MSEETAETETEDETRGASELDLPTHYQRVSDSPRPAADLTDEERAYHRKIYGVTHRERYGQPGGICVAYCLTPGQRHRGIRCPSCFQGVEIRPMDGSEVEPGATRTERFMAWVGGWAGAFCDALMFPFRVGRAHTQAVIRDTLRDVLEADLILELDHLGDILTVLEGIEGELRTLVNAVQAAGE